jgi:hypothetical protein
MTSRRTTRFPRESLKGVHVGWSPLHSRQSRLECAFINSSCSLSQCAHRQRPISAIQMRLAIHGRCPIQGRTQLLPGDSKCCRHSAKSGHRDATPIGCRSAILCDRTIWVCRWSSRRAGTPQIELTGCPPRESRRAGTARRRRSILYCTYGQNKECSAKESYRLTPQGESSSLAGSRRT